VFRYLKFGKAAGEAQAGGEMGLAVQLSFSKLSDDDLKAIVVYLRSVAAFGDAETTARFAQGKPFSEVAKFRGVGAVSSDEALPGGTAQLFAANCASCHGIGAGGSRDSYFPSLFHNSALATGAGRNLVAAILFGMDRSTTDGVAFMPGFGGKATDIAAFTNEQVVELANYLLQHYGNAAYSVTPQMVEQVRSGQAPKPLLATLIDVGKWLMCALLIAFVLWRIVRRSSRRRV
jgi:mono/diheme cytochrome c family protein